MTEDEIQKLALEQAAKSVANKRKVGAVLVSSDMNVLATGYNHRPGGGSCEDGMGVTHDDVVHAEIAALIEYDFNRRELGALAINAKTMYVTYKPCSNCSEQLLKYNIKYKIVSNFMKFNKGKVRYELISPEVDEALATVFSYGAKKYKEKNYLNCENTEEIFAALRRHMNSWRKGNKIDKDSGLPNLHLAITNVAMLIDIEHHNKLPSVVLKIECPHCELRFNDEELDDGYCPNCNEPIGDTK